MSAKSSILYHDAEWRHLQDRLLLLPSAGAVLLLAPPWCLSACFPLPLPLLFFFLPSFFFLLSFALPASKFVPFLSFWPFLLPWPFLSSFFFLSLFALPASKFAPFLPF